MLQEERIKRVLAKGSTSNHCHVIFGDISFISTKDFKVLTSLEIKEAEKRFKIYRKDLNVLIKSFMKDNKLKFIKGTEFFELNKIPAFVERRIKLQALYNIDIEGLRVPTIRHILHDSWINNGISTWTTEHIHIPIRKGIYEYVPQVEFNPLDEIIRNVMD